MSTKTLKLILRSAAGFSLTEIMIGGGILAGVGLASAQLFKDQKFAQKKIQYDKELSNYHQNLVKTMNIPANCNTTLKQFVPAGSASIPTRTIDSLHSCLTGCADTNTTVDKSFDAYTPSAYAPSPTPIIAVGNYTNASLIWRVDRIAMTGRANTGSVILKVDYTLNPKIPGSKTVSKDILINARFGNNEFKECVNSQESSINNLQNDLCKSLNLSEGTTTSDGRMARWDEPTQTCKVDGTKDCRSIPGMQVDGIGSDGVVRCKPIVNNTDAAAIQDAATIQPCSLPNKPQAYYDMAAKKMRVRCVPPP